MSSDEEDYMSEKFLSKCIPDKNDIKPGLIKNKYAKRQHVTLKKKIELEDNKRLRPSANREAERRNAGLQKPIGSDNKGFSLLQKMGYQPGQGIGKTGGRVEPVGITLKTDRFGLGRETVLKEIAELKTRKRIEYLKNQNQACNIDDYRKRISEKKQEKYINIDLCKSQKVCERLDREKNIDIPDQLWFWPEPEDTEEAEADEPTTFEPHEKLEMLTRYLRQCHLYCIWCGMQFNDDDDMKQNCTGQTRDDH